MSEKEQTRFEQSFHKYFERQIGNKKDKGKGH